MNIHEEHMKRVDAVNNAKTRSDHHEADLLLQGFRDGVIASRGSIDLMSCDTTQFERGYEHRPMCCGVFLDWEPQES